jgi:hypothetical protein
MDKDQEAVESAITALRTQHDLILHYGCNATEKGLEHPQRLVVEMGEQAIEQLAELASRAWPSQTQSDADADAKEPPQASRPVMGWCPVCDGPSISLPEPAEGTCVYCFNHLMTLRDPFADSERLMELERQLLYFKAKASASKI